MSLKWSLVFLLALASGCSVFAPKGPTEVARGEYYSAGKPEYDSFFIVLHEKQVQLLSAPQEPQVARRNLAQAVGLSADASEPALRERLEQELKKLAAQGLRVRLDIPDPSTEPTASATLYASDATTSTPLRASLPQEATRLLRSRNGMLATKTELDKLRVMSINLEGNVESTFHTDGPWKRDEVRRNLVDSQKVITLMQARAQEVADQAQSLLTLLTAVANTDASLGKAAAPEPAEEPAKPRRSSAPRAGGAARTNSNSKPGPTPTTTPTPGKPPLKRDDETSAPKPVPGNAPAEIEP